MTSEITPISADITPRTVEPWVTMDYGPSLINTYEVGRDGTNFA